MKKNSLLICSFFARITVVTLALVLFFTSTNAQSLVTWTMDKTNQYKPTAVAANVTAGSFSADAAFGSSFSSTTGFRLKQSLAWPTVTPTTNTFNVDFPISPKGNNDIILNGISVQIPGTNIAAGQILLMTPYYQIDGAGSWVQIAPAQSIVNGTPSVTFSGLTQPFYSTHSYVVRMYITTSTGATKNEYFYIWNVVLSGTTTSAAAKPTVSTLTAAKSVTTPKYAGTATGTYSTGSGFQAVTQSGVCWTTNPSILPDATLPTKTTDGSNGIINSNITGLSVATTYYVRAYAITQVDTLYGAVLSFTTDAASKPVLSTNSATNILSNKATSGGNISDNGGIPIIQEGICWSTTSGAETATSGTNFTKDGASNTAFSSLIKPLLPSTTYFAKAYAINNLGLSYASNEISFTTGVPVAIISASPAALSFGTVVLNSPSVTLSYTLSGTNLSPAAGTITVTPPVGFSISSSTNGGYITAPAVLTIPYTNNTLSTKVYVRQITSNYGANADNIIITGGGAVNPNIDTVAVTGNVTQDPNTLTNLGTDFWVGHGLEEHMSNKNGYGLQLYIAAGAQPSSVKVSIPGIPSFVPQYYTVAANSVQIVSGFPTGDAADPKNANGLPDARLYYTGVSDRGIHVEVTNNVPVAVFLYDYATNNSAGGSMVFPTNTWNSSYIVQTYGGAGTNTGSPNTYFFVMAKDDNTVVTFKPTNPIIDSASSPVISGNKPGGTIAYAANTTTGYQVVLNKGQVFNAVGLVDASTKKSYDLTGTIVTSDCGHPISVFAGNSRTLIDAPGLSCTPNSGSDNLIQQMFPKVAWGTQYLTVPTKTMEYNVFRIGVQDTATIVTVDGTPLLKTTLDPTGLFYEIEGNTCRKIVSDKPITVTQFILPGGACGGASVGNDGTGDPEMILLSPIQQAIKSTTVYMSDFKDGASGGTYINVVIPTSGVPSFRLDMALNPTQMVDTGTSSYVLDTICNCAYGFAKLIPIDSAFKPFPLDSGYSWARFHVDYQTNPVHTLSADIGFNAIAYGVAKGESWGYNAGTAIKDLTILVTANTPFGKSPTATTCKGNSTSINISLPYDPTKISSLQWVSANDPSVTPANDTTNVNGVVSTGSLVKDGVTYYTFKSPKNYTFDSLGTFKFTVTAFGTFTNECGGSKAFDVIMNVIQDTADFSLAAQSCGSAIYNFKDITKNVLGDTLKQWQWTFGVFGTSTVQNPQSITFPASGTYQIKLRTINNIGCYSDTVKPVSIVIAPPPVADFTMPQAICINPGTVSFINKSDTAVSGTLTYGWTFGDGTGTSTVKDPAYTYTAPSATGYTVKLIATSVAGCASLPVTHVIIVDTIPVVSPIISSSSDTIIAGHSITLIDNTPNGVWSSGSRSIVSLTPSGNSVLVKGLAQGNDVISYTISNSCKTDVATYPVVVITPSEVFIPNLFSPNNDGHNDKFYVRGSTALYTDVHLYIFSSWGNLLFESNGRIDNESNGWDGKYKGQAQPTGVYIYVAKLTQPNGTAVTKKGSITLIR